MNPVLAARPQRRAVATTIKEQDGRTFIGNTQDCTSIAEYAKAKHLAGDFGSSELKHAASIPEVIILKYLNERGVTFQEFMGSQEHIRAVLNSPDNAMFRIWPGRV